MKKLVEILAVLLVDERLRIFGQLDEGIIDNNQDFYNETLKGGGLLNDRAMLKYFVDHSAIAISWLMKYGVRLTDLTITGGMSKKRAHRPGSMEPVGFYLTSRLTNQVKNQVLIFLPGAEGN